MLLWQPPTTRRPAESTLRIDRKQASVAGVSTTFLDVGSGSTIVALHGVPTSSVLYEPLIPGLSGYRLVAPDLLGQGDTETPITGPLSYAAYKNHLDAFLAAIPPGDFWLLVHDLGGILGLEWAADHPERVRGIVVLSTTVTWSLRVHLIQAANLLCGRSILPFGMRWTLKSSRQIDQSTTRKWTQPWTRRRLVRGLDLFGATHLDRLRAKLGNIRAPVLLIWGVDDDIFPMWHANRITRRIPHATLVTVPRCGHWSTLDAPEQVASHMVDFMQEQESGNRNQESGPGKERGTSH
jgi:pimeloyl-ACP methyl ester carboxylesterase